jgi:pimeloyl-ACP methyl ester carboxylesterase
MLDRRTFIAAAPAVLFNVPAQSIAAPRSKESKSSMATNTHETTPNRFIEAGGTKYAYRRFGAAHGVPMVFLQHFRGSMDNWDPLLTNGFAKSRPVILFDNAGVGLSGGSVPDTIGGMADKALEVIDAIGLTQIDLLGFSMGGSIAQILTLKRPSLVRRLILAGTGPGAATVFSRQTRALFRSLHRDGAGARSALCSSSKQRKRARPPADAIGIAP